MAATNEDGLIIDIQQRIVGLSVELEEIEHRLTKEKEE